MTRPRPTADVDDRDGAGLPSTPTASRQPFGPAVNRASGPSIRSSAGPRLRRWRPTSAPSRLPHDHAAWSVTSTTRTSCSSSWPASTQAATTWPRAPLPGPLPAHQGPPARARRSRVGLPSRSPLARLAELHETYRAEYRAYYERHATADSPPIRGADPAIILVPGVGMFSYGRDKQTARVAGEFYVNAINVMRGAESVSTYTPISERREVPHRVLGPRRGQAAAAAAAPLARRAHRAGDGRGERHRKGDRHSTCCRGCLRRHRRPRPHQARRQQRRSATTTSPSASGRHDGPDAGSGRDRRAHFEPSAGSTSS